jgi:hypothetical protein
MIGLLHDPDLSPEQRALIAEKRAAYEQGAKKKPDASLSEPARSAGSAGIAGDLAGASAQSSLRETSDTGFPPGATLCHKCNTAATIIMDGCATCLNCGYSKCG